MATANSTAHQPINKLAAMVDDLTNAADLINQGATGFLFGAQMPDGSMHWMAGGALLGYDNQTAGAAMQLYIQAQRVALNVA